MRNKKILHLTLTKKWFDMILSGEKKEEYREIKPYWEKRFIKNEWEIKTFYFKKIIFRNGYSKNAPQITVECECIEIGKCKADWSYGSIEDHFVIKLGEILETKNIKTTTP